MANYSRQFWEKAGMLFLGLFLVSCSKGPWSAVVPRSAPPAATHHDEGWEHRWWLEKTVRILRGGDGLSASDDVNTLLSLPREVVVKRLVDDPRFGDMIVSFDEFFLGMPLDRVRQENGDYEPSVFNMPAAISSSRAVLSHGDFMTLFDLYQPPYFGPLERPLPPDAKPIPQLFGGPEDPSADTALRDENFKLLQDELKELSDEASKPDGDKVEELCRRFLPHADQRHLTNLLGLPHSFSGGFMMGPHWYGPAIRLCRQKDSDRKTFAEALLNIERKNETLFAHFAQMESTLSNPRNVSDIGILDISDLEPGYRFNSLQSLGRGMLVNTNTNLNRKRAGYVLNRYFCDNLTPVGVEAPASHAGDRHASDPACVACHYKLDPMAGFFRYHGRGFEDFTARDELIFDDQVKEPLAQYILNWKLPRSAHREWNVGYIRSLGDESQNDYGQSLDDLFAIFHRAPEVKHCLVQRFFEYLVSDTQAVDGDYLDYLTDEFTRGLTQDSSEAVKTLVTRIVLSRAFSEPNPVESQCLDYRPGHVPSVDSPPCQIASILRRRCVGCHQSVHDAPYLDLARFRRLEDGTPGFPHRDADGRDVAPVQTLREIAQRLMTTDPDLRMPYLTDMPNQERQALYSWAEGEESKP